MRLTPSVPFVAFALCLAVSPTTTTAATTYEVGDGKTYANINDVPLENIAAGDTVLIYYRDTPYHEKWIIAAKGTADAPITFRGVPGPNGELPIIDGESAVTRKQLSYWNEERSVIKIGGSNIPENDGAPAYITIENLEIRGARPPHTFMDDGGGSGEPVKQSYVNNAAAIHIEFGEHITIRGCTLHDCGNGFFAASGDDLQSRDILVEGNYIYGNGNNGSIYEHNNYTAAIGITFQFNRFGPLATGAGGNNLKDRSAGLVVRYNWIEGGNRQLDLVDAEDTSVIRDDPSYRKTFVYGNVLIEPANAGNRQIVHYGGDSGSEDWYRKGMLYFYHNTLVSTRTDRTTLMRLSTMDEYCDARNNILYVQHAGNGFSLLDNTGHLTVRDNWAKKGWALSFDGDPQGILDDDGSWIYGTDPGFNDLSTQDFELRSDSACLDAAGPLNDDITDDLKPTMQYVRHQQSRTRHTAGDAADLGAFERMPNARGDMNCDSAVNFEDIDAFVVALIDRADYEAAYPDCNWLNGDINDDGSVDFNDIDGFVNCIINNGC